MPNRIEALIRSTVSRSIETVADINRRFMKDDAPNPFLERVHAPLEEERTCTELSVTGEIPSELDGRYVRNGPNPITPPKAAAHHWFFGDAMLHGVRLRAGRAEWYRNRWIRGLAVSRALGERAAPGKRRRSDVVNTNIVPHAGRAWALVEAGATPVRIGPQLETIAHDGFGGTLRRGFSAHPHTDPDTGEMHAICYDALSPEIIHHVVVDKHGDVRREEPIRVEHGPMIHDCMITQHYVLILDLPVTFSMKRLLAGYVFPFAWNDKHRARVGLLPREGTERDIVWCDVDPCYVFHPCNGFETPDGKVILDVCVHDKMFERSKQGPDSQRVPFERWTIDPATKRVTRAVIDEAAQEFPRFNETRLGKPYRYAYCMGLSPRDAFVESATCLYKHDLEAHTRQVHDFGPDSVPGEFVFVPKASARAEDDGWLMGYVLDATKQTTDLVILDAARFEAEARARITIPYRIPPGFHGNWFPES
jgi:8'-apo-carotenoid 13,14-cleaving dioxygenase